MHDMSKLGSLRKVLVLQDPFGLSPERRKDNAERWGWCGQSEVGMFPDNDYVHCGNRRHTARVGMMANSGFSGEETLITGRIRGYRAWSDHVDKNGVIFSLQSIFFSLLFNDGEINSACEWAINQTKIATCLSKLHLGCDHYRHKSTAPEAECSCGLYACHTPSILSEFHESREIIGVIEAWGKVIVGPKGFRAQYARILGLSSKLTTVRDGLKRHAKGTPVLPSDELFEMFPPQSIEGMPV